MEGHRARGVFVRVDVRARWVFVGTKLSSCDFEYLEIIY